VKNFANTSYRRYVAGTVRIAVITLLVVFSACRSKPKASDETLKQQILSNDKQPLRLPPPPVAADQLDQDKRSRSLVLAPLASDLEKRVPQFQLRIKTTLDAPSPAGTRSEEHVWKRAITGNFSVRHSGSNEASDWIITSGSAFVKHNKGEWRKKPYTIEHSETLKRDVVAELSELIALFFDGIELGKAAPTNDNGHSAYSYKLSYTAPKTSEASTRAVMASSMRPVDLQGDIVVDRTTGALLTAELKATLELTPIPQQPPKPQLAAQTVKAKISWTLDTEVDTQKLEPSAPENAALDKGFERPAADVLGFWGIDNKKKAGDKSDEREEED
jgi:hypothetical protein